LRFDEGGAALPASLIAHCRLRVSAGAGAITLDVTGENFSPNTIARWNGADRSTTLVAASLKVTLTAEDLSKPGRNTLMVFSPVQC